MTVDEMEDLLERLDIEVISSRGSEVQAKCPGHKDRTGKEDNNPSWFINADTGAHICFSCHFKGGVQYLIGYINKYYDVEGNIDFGRAKEWIGEQESLTALLDRATQEKLTIEPEIKIDPAMLAAFVDPPDYALRSRGLSSGASQSCGLKWDERNDSWIIPIKDSRTFELLGWQQKAYRGRFFKNYPPGMKKSGSLFGYHGNLQGPVVLVESPLDAVRLQSLGVYGVASFGSFVSKEQLNLIKHSGKLIIALDNDDAGRSANKNIMSLMSELWFEAWFFDYSHTDQKDVGGMSRDEILSGLENAKHFVALMQGV